MTAKDMIFLQVFSRALLFILITLVAVIPQNRAKVSNLIGLGGYSHRWKAGGFFENLSEMPVKKP
jgi:hypothetical protein